MKGLINLNIWERQQGESDRDFAAFSLYLQNRNYEEVAKKCNKNAAHIRRLASKNNWRERARAYDNSIMEEVRQSISKRYANFVKRQWEGNEIILDKIYDVLAKRDFNSAGARTLNELVATLTQGQKEIAELLKLNDFEPTEEGAGNITINIVSAKKEC